MGGIAVNLRRGRRNHVFPFVERLGNSRNRDRESTGKNQFLHLISLEFVKTV